MADKPRDQINTHANDEAEFQLPEALERALEQSDIPRETSREIRQQIIAITHQFAGPMPHPEILREYEAILPGAAERLFTLAEANSLYRRSMGKTLVEANIRSQFFGTACGLIVALAGLASAVELGLHGQPWVAGIIASIDLIGLVAVFVVGQGVLKKESDDGEP